MEVNYEVHDMPKIYSPFEREERNGGYYCTDTLNPGYGWVLNDDRVKAVEKLHGTNVSVLIDKGNILGVWNRENRVKPFSTDKRDHWIIQGIYESMRRGYIDQLPDGQWFGELIGPKIQGNPYDLDTWVWIPFETYSRRKLVYKSWGEYPKTYDSIVKWLQDGLLPLFYSKIHGCSFDRAEEEGAFTEGIVFTHTEPEEIDTDPYAKIRYDMFEEVDDD